MTRIQVEHIKTGDCLLVHSYSFLAKKIQDFENCKWNHAGMFYNIYDELFVAEMVSRGLVLTHIDEYMKGKNKLMVCVPFFKVDKVEYGKYILSKIGRTRYGFFNLLIAQPIKFITNKRIWLGSNDNNPKRLICGEFVEQVYNHFNPELFTNWKKDAPSDIFNATNFTHFKLK